MTQKGSPILCTLQGAELRQAVHAYEQPPRPLADACGDPSVYVRVLQ
eukprot:CAMPEP_0168334286 /NCGR_PEP_ID=MMETSP0213-20121227/10166_1 /TAXON_ID=151035 /ORGANISM="Euplotes harpa, Strain FSP1.4" /LENGTH=46 /DNA_ID= /DNA_START= /DNA_END= /DNA_ORIENTATION=